MADTVTTTCKGCGNRWEYDPAQTPHGTVVTAALAVFMPMGVKRGRSETCPKCNPTWGQKPDADADAAEPAAG